jgi:hypothetical protein
MMYQQDVQRARPGCIVFLVDQSFSMTDPFAGSARSKAEAVATAINRFLSELVIKCEKGEEKPRYYFDVAVIGYTTDQSGKQAVVQSLLQHGSLAGRDLVSIVDIYDNPLEIEKRTRDDGAGGLVSFNFPIWYRLPKPETMLGTPIYTALEYCRTLIEPWCASHPDSFPPVVINLTDGESTEEGKDTEVAAAALRALGTSDGNVLLFNCHLSTSDAEGSLFPTSENQLPDDFSKQLFRSSSELPDRLRHTAEKNGVSASAGCRGMAFNADGTKMLVLINAGTAVVDGVANLR